MRDDAEYVSMVRDVLSAASLPIAARVERVPEGIGNHVYFAGDVVVRLGTGSDAPMFPRAASVLRAAARTVAVPEVVYEDCSCEALPVPIMVLARMPGAPLSRRWEGADPAQRIVLVGAVARELAKLHRIAPQDVLEAGFPDPWWEARASKLIRRFAQLRPTEGFPTAWLDVMEAYFETHRDSLRVAPPACVLHNDVNWGNVLVEGDRVTALLDFDDAIAGPPEEDWWQLVHRGLEAQPPLTLAQLREVPEVDLRTEGIVGRLRIAEIENILELLRGELSWVDAKTALADARETYQEAFASMRFERLLEALA